MGSAGNVIHLLALHHHDHQGNYAKGEAVKVEADYAREEVGCVKGEAGCVRVGVACIRPMVVAEVRLSVREGLEIWEVVLHNVKVEAGCSYVMVVVAGTDSAGKMMGVHH